MNNNYVKIGLNNNHTGVRYGRLVGVHPIGRTTRSHSRAIVWLWQCDCGNQIEREAALVKSGNTHSCGCYRRDLLSKGEGEAAFNRLYSSYMSGAKERRLEFCLTKDAVRVLTSLCCFYCGAEPQGVYRASGGNYLYNGIDRLDNTVGYTVDNCVPCCTTCNFAKGHMSLDAFSEWLMRIRNGTSTFFSSYGVTDDE